MAAVYWKAIGRTLAALAWVLAACPAVAQTAEPGEPLRVVVRTHSEAEHRLLERLQGQTSDLQVLLLESAATWPAEDGLHEELAHAQAIASSARAQAVVWLSEGDPSDLSRDRVLIYVDDPRHGRVLMRPLDRAPAAAHEAEAPNSPAAPFNSGQLEAAALVIRSTLRAIQAGSLVGVTPEEALAEARAEQEDATADEDSAEGEARPDEEAREQDEAREQEEADPHPGGTLDKPPARAGEPHAIAPEDEPIDADPWPSIPVGAWGELGGRALWDGITSGGQHALLARVGLVLYDFEVGLEGSYGFPGSASASSLRLELRHYSAGLFAGYRLGGASLWVTPTLGARVLALRHEAHAEGSLEARPAQTTWYVAASPALRASWMILGPLGLTAAAGLDLLPEAPRFGYGSDRGFVRPLRTWNVQPWVTICGTMEIR